MSKITFINDKNYLALVLPFECKILSSAVLNGGLSEVKSLLNLKVDKYTSAPLLAPDVTLNEKSLELKLPSPITGMMTAASMNSLGYCIESKKELSVECWVTSGLSNLRRVGDKADEKPIAGTINIWLYINQSLTDAALTEALIMLTESKVTVLRDNEVLSPISGLPASGTGTDSHAVFCPKDDNQIEYCGKHTLLGELIGKAVTNACSISIGKCLSL